MKLTLPTLLTLLTLLHAHAGNYTLRFNGVDQYARLGEGTGLDLSTGTIEAWVRFDTLYDEQCLVIRGGGATEISYGLFYDHATGVGDLYRIKGFVDNNGTWGPSAILGGTNPTPALRWVHVAMTFNEATQELKFYVDGRLNTTTTYNNGALFNSSNLRIGGGMGGWTHFSGEMDEVRIWNTERTEAEIASHRLGALTGAEPGLVAYFNFNEGSGDTLHDVSGNGNDATLVNMNDASWVAATAFTPQLHIAPIPNGVALTWPSGINLVYLIERADSLSNPTWQPAAAPRAGDGSILTNVFDSAATAGYFRLVVTNAP